MIFTIAIISRAVIGHWLNCYFIFIANSLENFVWNILRAHVFTQRPPKQNIHKLSCLSRCFQVIIRWQTNLLSVFYECCSRQQMNILTRLPSGRTKKCETKGVIHASLIYMHLQLTISISVTFSPTVLHALVTAGGRSLYTPRAWSYFHCRHIAICFYEEGSKIATGKKRKEISICTSLWKRITRCNALQCAAVNVRKCRRLY